MKLKFKPLVEAVKDEQKKRRYLYVQKLYPVVDKALKDSGYRFKSADEKGFYILPAFGHLVNFRFSMNDEGLVTILPAGPNFAKDKGNPGSITDPFPITSLDSSDSSVEDALQKLLIAFCNDALVRDGKLLEAVINEDNIFKTLARKVSTALAQRSIDKAENRDRAEQNKANLAALEGVTEKAIQILKDNYSGLSVEKKIDGLNVDVFIKADYILGVTLGAASNDIKDDKSIVIKLITADGKESSISRSDKLAELEGFFADLKVALGMPEGQYNNIIKKISELNGESSTDAAGATDATDGGDSSDDIERDLFGDAEGDADGASDPDVDSAGGGDDDFSSSPRLSIIRDALPRDAAIDLKALLGESISLEEALMKLANGVKPENYMKVYDAIKENPEAVDALIEHFCIKAFDLENVVGLVTSSGYIKFKDALIENQFKVGTLGSSLIPVTVGMYLKTVGRFPDTLPSAVAILEENGVSVATASDAKKALRADCDKAINLPKKKVTLKTIIGEANSVKMIDYNASSLNLSPVFCDAQIETTYLSDSDLALFLGYWYVLKNRVLEAIKNTLKGDNAEAKSTIIDALFGDGKTVEADNITVAHVIYKLFVANSKYLQISQIKKRFKEIIDIINDIKNSTRSTAVADDEDSESSTDDLTADEIMSLEALNATIERGIAIELEIFAASLRDIIEKKSLSSEDLHALQREILTKL